MTLGTPLLRGLGASVLRNRTFLPVEIGRTRSAFSSIEISTTSEDEDGPKGEDMGKKIELHLNTGAGWARHEGCDNLGFGARELLPVTFQDVSTATYRIRDGIVRTACTKSNYLSDLCGMKVYLKQEFMQ